MSLKVKFNCIKQVVYICNLISIVSFLKMKSLEHFLRGCGQKTLFLKVKKLSANKFPQQGRRDSHRGSSCALLPAVQGSNLMTVSEKSNPMNGMRSNCQVAKNGISHKYALK